MEIAIDKKIYTRIEGVPTPFFRIIGIGPNNVNLMALLEDCSNPVGNIRVFRVPKDYPMDDIATKTFEIGDNVRSKLRECGAMHGRVIGFAEDNTVVVSSHKIGDRVAYLYKPCEIEKCDPVPKTVIFTMCPNSAEPAQLQFDLDKIQYDQRQEAIRKALELVGINPRDVKVEVR